MVAAKDSENDRASFQFGDVCPSAAAHEELRWYYNDPLDDLPSCSGSAPQFFDGELAMLTYEARCADVMLAMDLIGARLGELRPIDREVLAGLYDEHPYSPPDPHPAEVCAAAIQAYERARGRGLSVVPHRDDDASPPRWCRSFH